MPAAPADPLQQPPRRSPGPPHSPRGIALAAGLVGLQGLGLLGLAVFYLVEILLRRAQEQRGALLTAALAALAGLALALVAWGITRRRRWARSPALLTQVFVALIAWQAVSGGAGVLGVPLLAWALALLALLLAPRVGGALRE